MTRKQALARLGLQEKAEAEEIKRAYRKLAFELHPDLHPDNPDASKEFQLLNEAYVFLTTPQKEPLTGRPRGQSRAQARAEATEKARADAQRAYERTKRRFQEEQKAGKAAGPEVKPEPAPGSAPEVEKNRERTRDEVLRDLLRDPFARRVFEDIYQQIREESSRHQKNFIRKAAQGPSLLGKTADNVSDWLRRQIDEEQTVKVSGPLTPGKRIRLQIYPGVFGKAHTVELTLPPQFEPGRPLRLKGLGKRLGKWRGDLYLRIVNQ